MQGIENRQSEKYFPYPTFQVLRTTVLNCTEYRGWVRWQFRESGPKSLEKLGRMNFLEEGGRQRMRKKGREGEGRHRLAAWVPSPGGSSQNSNVLHVATDSLAQQRLQGVSLPLGPRVPAYHNFSGWVSFNPHLVLRRKKSPRKVDCRLPRSSLPTILWLLVPDSCLSTAHCEKFITRKFNLGKTLKTSYL